MDYGAPPRKMFVVGMDLIEQWKKARCVSIGFFSWPEYMGRRNVAGMSLLCENLPECLELFKMFKKWDSSPGSGRGVDMTFLLNKAQKSYDLMIAPNVDEARIRMVKPGDEQNYSLIWVGGNVGKGFTNTTGGIDWLRSEAAKQPIIIAPSGPDQNPRMEVAIIKDNVRFFDQGSAPPEVAGLFNPEGFQAGVNRSSRKELEDEAASRRQHQMKRFFAVTLARLEFNHTFLEAAPKLTPDHPRWAIQQAACNLLIAEEFARTEKKHAQPVADYEVIYEWLIVNPENVFSRVALDRVFSAEELAAQAAKDSQYLERHQAADKSPPSLDLSR